MPLAAHAEQMDVEFRSRRTGFGDARQVFFVGAGRPVKVGAEPVVACRHGMDVAVRDPDVIEQCLAGLFLVAVVITAGHVPVVTEEQVHPRPVDIVGAEALE